MHDASTHAADSALPPDPARQVGFWLHFVSQLVTRRLEERLAEHGHTFTEFLAMRLMYGQEPVTYLVLIRYLGLTKGAASKLVRRLETAGLVKSQLMEGGARSKELSLTAKGEQLVPQLAERVDGIEAYFFGHMPLAERDALMRILGGLGHRFAAYAVPVQGV